MLHLFVGQGNGLLVYVMLSFDNASSYSKHSTMRRAFEEYYIQESRHRNRDVFFSRDDSVLVLNIQSGGISIFKSVSCHFPV